MGDDQGQVVFDVLVEVFGLFGGYVYVVQQLYVVVVVIVGECVEQQVYVGGFDGYEDYCY